MRRDISPQESYVTPHVAVHHVHQVSVPAARRLCSFLCLSRVRMPLVSCFMKNQMPYWYHVHKHKISFTWHPGLDRVLRLREHPGIFQGRSIPYPPRKIPDRSPGVPHTASLPEQSSQRVVVALLVLSFNPQYGSCLPFSSPSSPWRFTGTSRRNSRIALTVGE